MSGVIAINPRVQFASTAGVPLINGTLTTYLAGTTTPEPTYQDQALGSANTNPITLDSRGECVLWLDPTKLYKFVLKNAQGITQWTQDNIYGPITNTQLNSIYTTLAGSGGSALIGASPSGTVQDAIDALVRNPIVIFSTGQSNMPAQIAISNWSPSPNLRLWNFDANVQPSTDVGTAFATVSSFEIGPSVAAADVIAKANPKALVYVINIFRGGLGLVNWGPAPVDYNFRQAIAGNVPVALAAIGKTTIDHFVFGGAESDANFQSQTLQADLEANVMSYMTAQSWWGDAQTYIMAMSPWAASSPGNADYLWRRYNGALRAVVATYPSVRAFIDTEDFPVSLFDPGSAIPYIHYNAAGFHTSGIRLGRAMLSGMSEPVPRSLDMDGNYTSSIAFSNLVNCTAVDVNWANWWRSGNMVSVSIRAAVTNSADNVTASFNISIPVKVKAFPGIVAGHLTSPNGDIGIVIPVTTTEQQVQVVYSGKFAGVVAMCISFSYRLNYSDGLPNSPPGTS